MVWIVPISGTAFCYMEQYRNEWCCDNGGSVNGT